ncbi:MAG TPA: hypothetical protein VEC37_15680 [Bacillota bacterium]|nr:hypothetical protein [Bacillota bacterium]
MGETGGQKRLIILLIISLLSLMGLTWTIIQKNRQKTEPVVFNINPKAAEKDHDFQVNLPEVALSDYLPGQIQGNWSRKSVETGRADPFAKLAVELDEPGIPANPEEFLSMVRELQAVNNQGNSAVPPVTVPTLRVCGIVMGKKPAAYIEQSGTESGYRRITMGDRVADGTVVNITESSVEIRSHGESVTYHLGE